MLDPRARRRWRKRKKPPLSAVAGILDSKGGIRVVVAYPWTFCAHVGTGERIFIIPDCYVEEPVPFDEIPDLIKRVTAYVEARR